MSDDQEVQAVAVIERDLTPMMVSDVKGAKARLAQLQEFVQEVMIEGEDFGKIPGVSKPVLFKPGAEKLCEVYGFAQRIVVEHRIEQWDPPGFFHYEVKCELVSKRTGEVIGTGVGSCNSMEGRYRWRDSQRTCPACGQAAIIKGKEEYGGGFLCFAKKGGCGKKFTDSDPAIIDQTLGKVENDDTYTLVNCVTPDTRILTRDLRWVPAGDLCTGDRLFAVEEHGRQYRRSLREATATVYGRKLDEIFEVHLADGRMIRCNGEHKWLVKKVGLKGTEWAATTDIFNEITERHGRPRHWQIMSICPPWKEEVSNESGYMAGLFDADGSLATCGKKYQQIIVQFAQQDNIVAARMKGALTARGFAFTMQECSNGRAKQPVYDLRVRGGLTEQMRLLGMIRPPRLLDRWDKLVRLEGRRFEGETVEIEAVKSAGLGEIVLLGSSAGTYIAEGLVAHNTILKMAKKRAVVDATLSVTRSSGLFTQDEETLEAKAGSAKATIKEPVRASAAATTTPQGSPPSDNSKRKITTPQAGRFHAIASGAGISKETCAALLVAWGIASGSASDIPAALYEQICASAAAGPGEVEKAITNLRNEG